MEKYLVFVVEDDEDDWLFLKEAFGQVGCVREIKRFETPQLLLSLLSGLSSEQLPNKIVLDHQTPGHTGSQTVEQIRAKQLFNPILLVIYSTMIPPSIRNNPGWLGLTSAWKKAAANRS